jgi:chemotaxis protein CheX
MQITHDEVHEIVRSIWESILGWDIQPTWPGDCSQNDSRSRKGFIQITGAWEGALICIGSDALVRSAAATMYGLPADGLAAELLNDALGELTNMIGGNLKALLPGPSFLCLPVIVEGENEAGSLGYAQPVVELGFSSQGEPFMVKLLCNTASGDGIAPGRLTA